jgi:hypothetical protein
MPHDPALTPNATFPRLTPSNHRVTSPADTAYNCIAWALGDAERWWEPTVYWPDEVGDAPYSVRSLIELLATHGFRRADPASDIAGDWIAVYGSADGTYTHAARRLTSGTWASKLGAWEDVEHDTADAVAGGEYGEIVAYLHRPE